MKYLVEHVYQIHNNLHPEYYTMMKIKVPSPETADDKPIVLVALYNVKKSIFLTFTSVEDANRIFNLDAIEKGLKEDLEERLKTAATLQSVWVDLAEDGSSSPI